MQAYLDRARRLGARPQGRARRAGRRRAGVAAQGRAHRRHGAVDGALEGRRRPLPAAARRLGRRPGAGGRAGTARDADPGRSTPLSTRPCSPERATPGDAGCARRLAARGLPALRRAGRPAAPAALARPRGRRERRPGQGAARPARAAARPGRPRARRHPRRGPQRTWDELAARIEDVTERPQRGGDVGGLLGPLENDAAPFERDLIVGGAERRDARDRARRGARAARRPRWPAPPRSSSSPRAASRPSTRRPRYAVPDVEALGPVPDTPTELDAYRERLERVGDAMNLAHARTPPRSPSPRRPRRPARRATRSRRRPSGSPASATWPRPRRPAREVLARQPVPVAVATALVDAYETWLTLASCRTSAAKGSAMKCQQPGCTGTIVDGYCDVCGMAPRRAASAGQRAARAPSLDQRGRRRHARASSPAAPGTIVDGYCDVCGTPAGAPAADSAAVFQGALDDAAAATGSFRLAVGGHRLAARASAPARPTAPARRRSGCASARLGAGLTDDPAASRRSTPAKVVMKNPEVPEDKRTCAKCGSPVGRSKRRPARPHRGLLPDVRPGVLVHAQAARRRPGRAASTRSPAASPTAASAGSTSPATRTSPTAGSCSRACSTPATPTRSPRRSPSSSSWPRSSTR